MNTATEYRRTIRQNHEDRLRRREKLLLIAFAIFIILLAIIPSTSIGKLTPAMEYKFNHHPLTITPESKKIKVINPETHKHDVRAFNKSIEMPFIESYLYSILPMSIQQLYTVLGRPAIEKDK